ncbi:MlaD family protein [Oleispirillum naphthae]|uniref:MlaD family protein n=1 Tax=Oleispirillum naphthae TaxID=2838853 RepID=UPI0030826295
MNFGEREDIGLGALVCLIGAGLLAYLHGREATPESQAGYPLYAAFQRSDGLMEGAPVRLSGIDVGKVGNMELRDGFRALATLRLDDGIRVPTDSAAVIHTDGLFGAKYVEIEPGGAAEFLSGGDALSFTQDSLVVEDLLERLVAMAKSQQAKCAEALAAPPRQKPEEPSGKAAPALLVPTDKGN